MADYDNLATIVGQMKRAAIDCWMADQGFYPTWGYEETYCKWHFAPYQYFRPAEDGSGGGESVGYGDQVTCAAGFDNIRAAIDAIVSKWIGLPDGSHCETPQHNANATAAMLGTGGASPSVQDGGEIGTSNNTVQEVVINNMHGAFRYPFLDKYYTQFACVNSGLGQASVILEANYAAQSAMWPAARTDVAMICDNAKAAWAAQAGLASSSNTAFTLTVVGAVAAAVASVVTAGTGTVAAVTALSGIALAANTAMAAVAEDASVSGNSYADILASLDSALSNLNHALAKQEEALNKMMDAACTAMHNDLADYDLDAFSLGYYPATDGTMAMDTTDAAIVSRNMERIETSLAAAKARLGGAPASNPTPRNYGVGCSSTGTHTSATELYALTARCLELTTAEYGRGLDLFRATVTDFFRSDAESQQAINRLLADEALTADVED